MQAVHTVIRNVQLAHFQSIFCELTAPLSYTGFGRSHQINHLPSSTISFTVANRPKILFFMLKSLNFMTGAIYRSHFEPSFVSSFFAQRKPYASNISAKAPKLGYVRFIKRRESERCQRQPSVVSEKCKFSVYERERPMSTATATGTVSL